MNVLHMLLPSGELWFCRLYNKALPLVSDARLRDDVQGFIRQEAMHSRAHDGAIQRYLSRFDIDSSRSPTRWISFSNACSATTRWGRTA